MQLRLAKHTKQHAKHHQRQGQFVLKPTMAVTIPDCKTVAQRLRIIKVRYSASTTFARAERQRLLPALHHQQNHHDQHHEKRKP